MLRLEKALKTHEINVLLRPKEPFFNRVFCLALLWAVGIHLLGLLIFNIAPFKVNYSDSIFPPVAVASDLGAGGDGHALAFLDEQIRVPQHLLLPLAVDLSTPPIPATPPVKLLEYQPSAPSSSQPFLSSELRCLSHGELPIEPAACPPVKIQISGPLARYGSGVQPAVDLPASLAFLQGRDYTFSFDVRVDGRTGRPIWVHPKGQAPAQIILWGEEVVKRMRFEGTGSEVAVVGTVEIFISVPQRRAAR